MQAALEWFRNHLASCRAKHDMLLDLEVYKVTLGGYNREVKRWTIDLDKEEDDGPFVTLCEALVGEKSKFRAH